MPRTLEEKAVEEGTYPIIVEFHDGDGAPIIPNAGLSWTLTDADGNVINNRSEQPLPSQSSVTIPLKGADLALPNPKKTKRILLVEGTYNSDMGNDLPLLDEVTFYITDLVNRPAPEAPEE